MDHTQFNRWTDFWMGIASNLFTDFPDIKAELESSDKIRLAGLVFQRAEPACIAFMRLVTGAPLSSPFVGVCYNRLTKVPIQQMPAQTQSSIVEMLKETLYLGLFTQLFYCTFPTRERILSVNLDQVFQKWLIDAIAPSQVLGEMDQVITDIFQVHFDLNIEPLIKRELRLGLFGAGRHRRFLLELYLAGFLLGLQCDMATKN